MRSQFWAALVGGSASAVLAVVTLISRKWIEFVFGVDPDGGNGGLEWAIVLVTTMTTAVCFWWARIEWRRARSSEVSNHG